VLRAFLAVVLALLPVAAATAMALARFMSEQAGDLDGLYY
jgi:hypothetical protein